MAQMFKCIQTGCGRIGEDIGKCGAMPVSQGGTCPNEGTLVEPGKDVLITNRTKGVTRVFSSLDIARGKAKPLFATDITDEVTAAVIGEVDLRRAGVESLDKAPKPKKLPKGATPPFADEASNEGGRSEG